MNELTDDYLLECDLARAICGSDDFENDWPSFIHDARSIIASVRKAGYEIVKPKRRNIRRAILPAPGAPT